MLFLCANKSFYTYILADTNLKGYFVVETHFQTINFNISDTQIRIRLRFGMATSIKAHFWQYNPLYQTYS